MSLNELMKDAREKLVNAKADVEAGKDGAVEVMTAVMEEVKGIQSRIDAVNESAALLKGLGSVVESPVTDTKHATAKNLGEYVANAVKARNISPAEKFAVNADYKAAQVMGIDEPFEGAITVDTNVAGYRRQLMVADLFGSESISGNALTYYVESATVEGGPATVAQGAVKPFSSMGFEPVTVPLQKIGAHYKETAELVEDAPWLASSINGRGLYLHEMAVESFLLGELMGTSGVQTGEGVEADDIFKAMMAVQTASGFTADAIIINPVDYQTLRLAKDGGTTGQYYGGGYFYAPYGNGGVMEQPPLWGLRTVITPAIEAGHVIVGAFRLGGSVIRKGGVSVNIANTNEDDFIHNVITVLIEERLALAVRYPAAFVMLEDQG